MRLRVAVTGLVVLLGAGAALAQSKAPQVPVGEARQVPVGEAKLMAVVGDGVFELRQGKSVDLTKNQLLLTFRRDQNKQAVEDQGYIALTLAGIGFGLKPGDRLNLKSYNEIAKVLKDTDKCFLDLIDVVAPKGAPANATFRFSCL